jgi:hypothetical protein
MDTVERQLALTGYAETPSTATVTLHRFGRAERFRRAAKGAGAAWAAALASVFIPVAHFVLVPTFVALGAFLGWSRARAAVVVVRAHGACPDCGAEQDLDVHGRWRIPHPVACRACRRALTLREPSAT